MMTVNSQNIGIPICHCLSNREDSPVLNSLFSHLSRLTGKDFFVKILCQIWHPLFIFPLSIFSRELWNSFPQTPSEPGIPWEFGKYPGNLCLLFCSFDCFLIAWGYNRKPHEFLFHLHLYWNLTITTMGRSQ